MCIKADSIDEKNNPISIESVYNAVTCYLAEYKKVLLIIDQIDALSQGLSNDRTRLNNILSVVKDVTAWQNVKTIVSCRKYDLEYDVALNRLNEGSEVIEVGLLSDEAVSGVLERLQGGLKDKINAETFKVLKNAQFLNTFCFIYYRNNTRHDFKNSIELYDALWDSINGTPRHYTTLGGDIQEILFEIARSVQRAGTLKPAWTPSSSQERVFSHLASSGIIYTENNTVSFFHQTFYEYVLARQYVANNKSFVSDLEYEYQGLELRSTVKAVLEFYRGHNECQYLDEIEQIFKSDRIRLHIKLLAVSVIASVESPKPFEKRIINNVCRADERLLNHFMRGAHSEKWFGTVMKFATDLLPDSTQQEHWLIPMLHNLSQFAFNHPEDVFKVLFSIKDDGLKRYSISYILHGHNDYNKDIVIDGYNFVHTQNTFDIINRVQDALLSNKDFALGEIEKLLVQYLKSNSNTQDMDHYYIVDTLCKEMKENYPGELLDVLGKSIIRVIEEQSCPGCFGLNISYRFTGLLDRSIRDLLTIFQELSAKFASDEIIIKPIVQALLSLNNETAISLAFYTMSNNPGMFRDDIRKCFSEDSVDDKFMQGDIMYYYLRMLKGLYDISDGEYRRWYQSRILKYESCSDFIADKERKYGKSIYPHLWFNKWILICNTLSDQDLLPELKKCNDELKRRYRKEYIIEEPVHTVACAVCCGGVVDRTTYAKFSRKTWLRSFTRLTGNRRSGHGREYISLNEHANAFKNCVTDRPDYFKGFILDISKRSDIPEIYKIAGLKGLLAGGGDLGELWPLASGYITDSYASEDCHSFAEIVEYYLKNDNEYLDKILPVLKEIATSPLSDEVLSRQEEAEYPELERRVNEMLTAAINSKQGVALRCLIHACRIIERRDIVYDSISNIISGLNNMLRCVLIYELPSEEYHDERLFPTVFKILLDNMGAEALIIRGPLIQWYFYNDRNIVEDYIEATEGDPASHKILSQIFYYGLGSDKLVLDCKDRLDRLLACDDEVVVSTVVRVSLETYSDDKYTIYARSYLEKYASDTRESVVRKYQLYCDKLPVEALGFYRELSKKNNKSRSKREIHDELKYISKCIEDNPVMCYKFIKEQNYTKLQDSGFADEEIVKVLLMIYKKLKTDEDLDSLNEIMDMFDEYIFRGNGILYSATTDLSTE